jgi:hypothetical protein
VWCKNSSAIHKFRAALLDGLRFVVVTWPRSGQAAMFVRVKKIGPYEYLYLVENVREGGRHVQRVIKALGRRDEIENSDLLDGLIASAARHSRRSIVLSRFYRGELAERRRRSIGADLVFGRLWEETGCRAVLRRHLADRQFGFDASAPFISPCCIG